MNAENIRDRRVQKQAADWVACVYSGNASQADENALSAWLDADERHAAEYAKMLATWAEAAPETETVKPKLRFFMSYGAIAAAMFAFLLVGTGVFYSAFMGQPQVNGVYATAVGETRNVTLADGSIVTLNTGSKLFVDYSGGMRRAVLDSGEAFFDVAKDSGRPFVVTSGTQSVTVLGTSFNVKRQGAEVTIAVVQGLVAVHENLEPAQLEQDARHLVQKPVDEAGNFQHHRLKAGSVATFADGATLIGAVAVTDVDSHQLWRQGILRFENSSLQAVVQELSRYSIQPIVLQGEHLGSLSLSGVFHHNDLAGAFEGLEAMLPIRVRYEDDTIIISARKVPANIPSNLQPVPVKDNVT